MTIDRYRDKVKNLENDVRRNKAMFEQTGSDTHREHSNGLAGRFMTHGDTSSERRLGHELYH